MIDIASVKTGLVSIVTHFVVFGLAWFYQADRYTKIEAGRLVQELKSIKLSASETQAVQTKLEVARDKVRVKYVKELIEVPIIVEKPVYTNICIDEDGVKLIND